MNLLTCSQTRTHNRRLQGLRNMGSGSPVTPPHLQNRPWDPFREAFATSAVKSVDDSSESWRREKVSFDAAYGKERVTAYIYLPKGGHPPYQTAVFFPGSNAIQRRSSQDVLLRGIDFLPRSGRAMVYPIYKSTY